MADSYRAAGVPRSGRTHHVTISATSLPERTTVIDGIVAEIRGKIVAGELRDGDMLASQDELARTLGVSRASLREALNRLSLMGMIEMRHGSGTYVRIARPQDFMNSLSALVIMDRASAAEVLQARFHVEAAVALLAAQNATRRDIERLRHIVEQMEQAFTARNDDEYVALDAQFHVVVAATSKNRVLMKVLEVIQEILPQCIRRFHVTFPERVPITLSYHRAIFEAIARHDPMGARRNMEGHIGFLIQLNDESEATSSAMKAD